MRARLASAALVAATWLSPGLVNAQDPPVVPAAGDELTLEAVQEARETIAASEGLDEAARTQVVGLYDRAVTLLTEASALAAQAADYERQRLDAANQIAVIRAEIEADPGPTTLELPEDVSSTDLAPRIAQAEADLSRVQTIVADLEEELRTRPERRASLPTSIADVRSRVRTLDEELAAAPSTEASAELTAARRTLTRAQRRRAQAELRALEEELLSYDPRGELLSVRHEQAVRQVTRVEERLRKLRETANLLRQAEAEQAAQLAQEELRAAAESDEVVRELARANAASAERRAGSPGSEGLAPKISAATAELEAARRHLENLRSKAQSLTNKVRTVGLTRHVGGLLVDARAQLRGVRDWRRSIDDRADEIADARFQRIDNEEELARLVDLESRVQDEMQRVDPNIVGPQRDEIERAVHEQLHQRREILQALQSDYARYVTLLGDLDVVERTLIKETVALQAFIDERVLWVRIARPLHDPPRYFWKEAGDTVAWLLDTRAWRDDLGHVLSGLGRNSFGAAWRVGVVLLLFLLRRPVRKRIVGAAYLVGRIRTDRFLHTIQALVLSLVLAVTMPSVIWLAAELMSMAAPPTSRTQSIVEGLRAVAVGYLLAEIVRVGCRPSGLAEAHFRWPKENLQLVRRHVRWLILVGLPAVLLVVTLRWQRELPAGEAVGRLAFIAGQLALSVFMFQVLRPKSGALASFLERHPTGWLSRLTWIWFPLVFLTPLSLAIMSELGYVYTAHQLHLRVAGSMTLVLGLTAVHATLMRWLFVARRQLALQQYRKRRAAAQAEAEAAEGRPTATLSDELVAEEDAIDIPSVSAQSQRIVQVLVGFSLVGGIGWIWADVLPALRLFDEVELWSHTVETEQTVTGLDQTAVTEVTKKLVPVTLADVLLALVLLIITVVAARNLPGLLEIAILQQLPLQRSARYAVTTIARYLIIVVGSVVVFGAVGITWKTVQWLAAAITVGLGFGLQEIFANFVSGLILLFERPIRVGDTVTVASVTGTVTRIDMRSTTILTWDRTELIVPNREFITSQLVNWTLSDSVLRVICKVGIAYGSDTKKAEELLYEIARETPDILDEPPPNVVFKQFGDSTLDFELRCFVTTPELYRTIHHQLNNAIDAAFRESGIEIAFPQRDLHLRTAEVALPIVQRGAES